jgi:hypothetical protein
MGANKNDQTGAFYGRVRQGIRVNHFISTALGKSGDIARG